MRTIDKIITNVSGKYGAPMGRIDRRPQYRYSIINIEGNRQLQNNATGEVKKVFDCYVPMNGAYDRGGAYWGLGSPLRVSYTKDLTYVEFYRV